MRRLRRFGPQIALIGGIDAGALTRDAATVRDAVAQTVTALLDGHLSHLGQRRPILFE